MANRIMSNKEVVAEMMAEARRSVADMPVESARKLAEYEGGIHPGIGGAIGATLILAARERMKATGETK